MWASDLRRRADRILVTRPRSWRKSLRLRTVLSFASDPMLLTTFFVKYKPTPRPRSRAPTETNGSSSRVADGCPVGDHGARFAEHPMRGCVCRRRDGGGHRPGRASDEVDPADFGGLASFRTGEGLRRSPGTFGSSLAGSDSTNPPVPATTPAPDQREKSINGDVLPMRRHQRHSRRRPSSRISPSSPIIASRLPMITTGRHALRARMSMSYPLVLSILVVLSDRLVPPHT
ncbi:hypothetical protein PGTUg99_002163 [Puccinia graminis f. sp. tritici]|uniref:Uncharacterized protein n=1 Tax=Puccinia graminis f. sp. tritici TaxID=56615 RepID=A0A5B0QY60_PUCGR|nr:hypothetical protein PGTUg99_002163 [Puccinia graminis f. sp. tritici]